MNERTGEIRAFPSAEEARRAGFDIQLTEDQARQLTAVDPLQRVDLLLQPFGVTPDPTIPARLSMPRTGGPRRRFKVRPRRHR